jgi:hypothetical protein
MEVGILSRPVDACKDATFSILRPAMAMRGVTNLARQHFSVPVCLDRQHAALL